MKQSEEPLRYALAQLAHACDGASTRDGAGFNRMDAHLGKFLAGIPESSWGEDDRRWAYNILRKYTAQLARYGVIFKDLPKPRSVVVNTPVDLRASDKW